MIRLIQTRMKIHHASSILPIKYKLFTNETFAFCFFNTANFIYGAANHKNC
jgi:hypothetical protein